MSTPARRRLVLVISSLSLGLTLGCSASETTNTVAYTAGGTVATGGQNGTSGGGAANAGGKGGVAATGGASAIVCDTTTGAAGAASVLCALCGICTGLGTTCTAAGVTYKCNGGRYYPS